MNGLVDDRDRREVGLLVHGDVLEAEVVIDGGAHAMRGAHRVLTQKPKPFWNRLVVFVRPQLTVTMDEIPAKLKEAERVCPQDGAALREIGVEVSEQLDIVPQQVRVIRHERVKYACPCCSGHVRTAPAPARPPSLSPGQTSAPARSAPAPPWSMSRSRSTAVETPPTIRWR